MSPIVEKNPNTKSAKCISQPLSGLGGREKAVDPGPHLSVPVGEFAVELLLGERAVFSQDQVARRVDRHRPAAGGAFHRMDLDAAAAPLGRGRPVAEEEAPILVAAWRRLVL